MSICFELPHKSGSLYHMLSHFIYNNLNMTKIESRPIEDRNWEYRFFIDFEGNLADSAVKNALRGLRDEARNMKILGNYKTDRILRNSKQQNPGQCTRSDSRHQGG